MSTKAYKTIERYMVAHIVGEARTNQTFEVWPRHVTFHPWFSTYPATAVDRFMTAIRIIEAHPIDRQRYPLGGVAMFGPAGDKRVHPLASRTALGFMHGVLAAQFFGFDADNTYMGGRYNPHETEVDGTDYDDPDIGTFVVDSLCLVRRDMNCKTIVCAEKF